VLGYLACVDPLALHRARLEPRGDDAKQAMARSADITPAAQLVSTKRAAIEYLTAFLTDLDVVSFRSPRCLPGSPYV
jgi:hypothetical protein